MTDPQRPFAFREFRFFWTARLCSTLAQNSLVVVIGWQVYSLARSSMGIRRAALQLGLIGLAQFLPLFALTLVTGWVADRVDRRRIAMVCVALQLLCAVGLAVPNLLHSLSLTMLFAVAVLLGVARAFSMPALSALAPNLVPRAVVPRAIAANAIASRVGGVLGPAMGGYLYAVGPSLPYLASVLLLAISLCAMACLRPHPRAPDEAKRNPLAASDRWVVLRPPQPARARRDFTRSVRSAARRRHRDAADLRPGHITYRTGRTR